MVVRPIVRHSIEPDQTLKMRAVAALIAFAVITSALIPVQWVAVRCRLPLRRSIPVFYHRILCRLLGVRITVVGEICAGRPLLIAANHVSWIDISVVTALAPVVFVAKREVAAWPLFGLLAKLQRSVFVDRAQPRRTPEVNREIAGRLADGDPVVLFAEGTSSDGNRVLAFRSSLIGAAHAALDAAGGSVLVQPMAIAYTRIGGVPAGRQHRPQVAWYGAMELVPHLLDVLRRGAIDVTVSWGEPVECAAVTDRKALARMLEEKTRAMAIRALRS